MAGIALPEPPIFFPANEGWRHRTAGYVRNPTWRGWYQDGRKLRDVKAPKAFIWPKDGKNGSSLGRIKDIFRNTGPDMYVAFGARPTDCVSNRPSRSQWAGHTHFDDGGMAFSFNSHKFAPWTRAKALGGREHSLSYDFRTRKHAKPNQWTWTDAIWQQEPYKNRKWNCFPEAVQTVDGRWYQDTQCLPQFRGGPVDNEFGTGFPFRQFPPTSVR